MQHFIVWCLCIEVTFFFIPQIYSKNVPYLKKKVEWLPAFKIL